MFNQALGSGNLRKPAQAGGLDEPALLACDGEEAPVSGVLVTPDHLVLKTLGSLVRNREELLGLVRDGGRVELSSRRKSTIMISVSS